MNLYRPPPPPPGAAKQHHAGRDPTPMAVDPHDYHHNHRNRGNQPCNNRRPRRRSTAVRGRCFFIRWGCGRGAANLLGPAGHIHGRTNTVVALWDVPHVPAHVPSISNSYSNSLHNAPCFQNGLQAKPGFEMCFDIGSRHLGCWGQNTSPYAQSCDLS